MSGGPSPLAAPTSPLATAALPRAKSIRIRFLASSVSRPTPGRTPTGALLLRRGATCASFSAATFAATPLRHAARTHCRTSLSSLPHTSTVASAPLLKRSHRTSP